MVKNPSKSPLFTAEERMELLRECCADWGNVKIGAFQGLLVDFCREQGADLVVRGLRAVSDFEYEFQMAQMNQELHRDLETVFLTPDVKYSFLSASLVREVARLGGDIGSFVSPPVLERMKEALSK